MADKNKLTEDLQHFEQLDVKDHELIQKLNEFMLLLEKSGLDSNNIKGIQVKINSVIDQKLDGRNLIKEIKQVSLSPLDKFEQLNQLENLLNNNHLDSTQTRKIKYRLGFIRIVRIIIGFLLITLGFSMIIMPAPPYFEMFTIFYFTPDDGVTLMDLISLIIVVTGFYIILKSILNSRSYE